MRNFLLTLLAILPLVAYAATDNPTSPIVEVRNKPQRANDTNIFGHIISANSNEHIPYATIAVKDTTLGCAANGSGHYTLNNLPSGKITLVISAIGFQTKEITHTTIDNESQELNIALVETTTMVDEVVVSATRNETNRRNTATVVNVASTKLFEGTASSSLSEAMNFQSGLRVENTCGNCGAPQLRINGLEGQYSQILLDSRAIFSSLAGVYGLDLMPVAMVERVEVIRGGGSALFGSNAIGGVVNIITKDPVRNTLSLSNTTNIMEDGTPDINTSIGGAFVSDDYKLGTYIFGQVKNRGGYDRNDDGFSDLAKLRSETLGFRGYYKTSTHSRLTAEYHHIHEFRRGGDNFEEAPHMAWICEQLDHNIDGGGLKFDLFPNSRHRFSAFVSAQGINRSSYFGTDMNPNAYGTSRDFTAVGGAQYTYNYKAGLPSELTVGAEYNYNNLYDNYVATNRILKQTTSTYGIYAQNEWKSDQLNILVGFRLDKHNMIDRPIFAPRANLRYSPIENLGLRLSYSSGYRAPQAYNEDLHIDAHNHAVSLIVQDPNLRPEFSHSLSASADYYHNFGRLEMNILVEGFYTMLNDVFTLVNNGEKVNEDGSTTVYRMRTNASGARVGGITTEVKLGIPKIFDLQLGYTYQQSKYVEAEQWSDVVEAERRMFRSPDHYGYLSSNFFFTKRFSGSLFATFTGPMLVQHNAHSVGDIDFEDCNVTTPSFFDAGLKLSYTFSLTNLINLEINGGVKNIFDAYQTDLDWGAGRDSTYIYGPSMPRTYFIGIKLSL